MTNNAHKLNKTDNLNRINYHFDFKRYKQHLVDVTLTFTAQQDSPIVWLPSWIPGSYLMREFSRNITAVTYQTVDILDQANDQTNILRAIKCSKNEWQLPLVSKAQRVTIYYEVYCYDLSVRTAYVDQTRLYGNFTSLALAINGREADNVEATLSVPQSFVIQNSHNVHHRNPIDFDQSASEPVNHTSSGATIKLACGLAHTHMHTDSHHYYKLHADSYHDLIDYPFEIAVQDEFDFIIHDSHQNALAHRFFIAGKHSANLGRLQQDVTHICQTYVNWLGDAPFGSAEYNGYTFMTYASGNDYGGLEHINSASLITPRSDLPAANEPDEPSEGYQRFLGLCSHEYFHAWWVKTVRPDVMMDVDLRKEAYTPLLWVFEGFTSYIDDFMLQASGVINTKSYLKLLATQINRYRQTHGRALQSVAESSFDAWIKLYRADENTGNAGISYYNKGALVALCLDLLLIKHSDGKYRLFDVVKRFYEHAKRQQYKRIGMTEASLDTVIGELITQQVWQEFAESYVYGTKELPVESMLSEHGVSLKLQTKDNTLAWGVSVEETPAGLKVNKVLRDSVASEAGLSAKDIIVAIDGIKATKKQLNAVAEMDNDDNETIICHAFRRDELMTLSVQNKTASGVTANPSLEKIALMAEESACEGWLKPNFAV